MLNKVMFFLPTLGGGGAERTVIQLANSFVEQGLNIHLAVCNIHGEKGMEKRKHVMPGSPFQKRKYGKVAVRIGCHVHVEMVAEKIALDRRIS